PQNKEQAVPNSEQSMVLARIEGHVKFRFAALRPHLFVSETFLSKGSQTCILQEARAGRLKCMSISRASCLLSELIKLGAQTQKCRRAPAAPSSSSRLTSLRFPPG